MQPNPKNGRAIGKTIYTGSWMGAENRAKAVSPVPQDSAVLRFSQFHKAAVFDGRTERSQSFPDLVFHLV